MEINNWVLVVSSITIVNVVIYFVFKKKILQTPNAGIKFLVINLPKDIAWVVFSIMILDRTKENFFLLCMLFLWFSFVLYGLIIRLLNNYISNDDKNQ
ncbi:hypothetical protein [Riemerella columbipharyngis]|uniref:PQ loop repeat-containing protein n=1 Tax=Riemerella columbipharyngis TaxID=1071918 RepID=A0A1G7FA39_9FLAO|nr:hypothetical protein [Riemerella columbipharyngis]SDE72798.1 hypothetical protein SAMN05421544_1217 [Riemerella columbipharyngis]